MSIFAEVPKAIPATRKGVVLINRESRYKGPINKIHPETGLPPAFNKTIIGKLSKLDGGKYHPRDLNRVRGKFDDEVGLQRRINTYWNEEDLVVRRLFGGDVEAVRASNVAMDYLARRILELGLPYLDRSFKIYSP